MAELRQAHFPGRAPIEAYGAGGFRFAGMSHRGGLIVLPSGIHGIDAGADPDLAGAVARVLAEAAGIDVLLIGTGARNRPLAPDLRARLRAARIVAETMSTGAAVRTYNVLLAEGRAVAAVLVAVD